MHSNEQHISRALLPHPALPPQCLQHTHAYATRTHTHSTCNVMDSNLALAWQRLRFPIPSSMPFGAAIPRPLLQSCEKATNPAEVLLVRRGVQLWIR